MALEFVWSQASSKIKRSEANMTLDLVGSGAVGECRIEVFRRSIPIRNLLSSD